MLYTARRQPSLLTVGSFRLPSVIQITMRNPNISGNDEVSARVTVIIVNFNSGAYVTECLTALFAQTFQRFHAILVDNASTDDSLDRVKVEFHDHRLSIIENGSNLGFAEANNIAARYSSTDWIATLNPDTVPDRDWLESMMEATEEFPDVAMFGAILRDACNPNVLDGAGDNYFFLGVPWRGGHRQIGPDLPRYCSVFGPCAAAALYKRSVFQAVGGFAEDFFCYVEDVDFAFRMRLAGQRCILLGNANVRHVGSAISRKYSGFAEYHGTRNRIWTFVRNMPGILFWLLLPGHIVINVALLVLALFKGSQNHAARGVLDALRGIASQWSRRREIQRTRTVSNLDIARCLCWSPRALLRRSVFLRPLTHQSGARSIPPRQHQP
jgi:N-acetylglucosaminyl-diphospho-decaprenol L-rhamnosyltransferase